jgi:hypothetical protein
MALDKLLKQIRMIIREEIEYALEKRLDESIKPKQKEALQHGMNLMKEVSKKKQPVKTKTGLSIQDLLNETRMSIESSMYDNEEYPTMKFNSSMVSTPNIDNMVPQGYSSSEITPEVEKALTRDYSALVAKMNEKSGR